MACHLLPYSQETSFETFKTVASPPGAIISSFREAAGLLHGCRNPLEGVNKLVVSLVDSECVVWVMSNKLTLPAAS